MWWECSECGGCIERYRAPLVCPECGLAGTAFVAAEGPMADFAEIDDPRAHWLLAGELALEHAAMIG
jgi:hypothetical protein